MNTNLTGELQEAVAREQEARKAVRLIRAGVPKNSPLGHVRAALHDLGVIENAHYGAILKGDINRQSAWVRRIERWLAIAVRHLDGAEEQLKTPEERAAEEAFWVACDAAWTIKFGEESPSPSEVGPV
jgi:hypothetical protein